MRGCFVKFLRCFSQHRFLSPFFGPFINESGMMGRKERESHRIWAVFQPSCALCPSGWEKLCCDGGRVSIQEGWSRPWFKFVQEQLCFSATALPALGRKLWWEIRRPQLRHRAAEWSCASGAAVGFSSAVQIQQKSPSTCSQRCTESFSGCCALKSFLTSFLRASQCGDREAVPLPGSL